MKTEAFLTSLGIELPQIPPPLANYIPAKKTGKLVFTAGQVSAVGTRVYKGKLGAGVSTEQGKDAARLCIINCLAAIKNVVGSLDLVKEVIAVHGLINSIPDFTGQAEVMNGASDFVVELFGEKGKHTRTAVGVASLPHDFTASIYMIVEVE